MRKRLAIAYLVALALSVVVLVIYTAAHEFGWGGLIVLAVAAGMVWALKELLKGHW